MALFSQPNGDAFFTNDAVVFGILTLILGFVFYTQNSKHKFWKSLYKYLPALLLCYFIPSLFNSSGLIDGEHSKIYSITSRILLPASLVLLTISTDLKQTLRLGPKALIMFLTGTVGVIIGGPIAVLIMAKINPVVVGGEGADATWRGLAAIAGSWIGGGANQAAMKEVFGASGKVFSAMVAVDVIVANLWVAVLFFIASRAKKIDAYIGADTSAIEEVKQRVEQFQQEHSRLPKTGDFILMCAIAFGVTGFAHAMADLITPAIQTYAPSLEKYSLTSKFFWIVIIATLVGMGLSFIKSIRNLEGAGASTIGTVLLYLLIASIGMQMDITALIKTPGLFAVGVIWMSVHAILLFIVAYLIKAPMFYLAVGSQANIGGAASAPIIASAFHPSLAPVGVLLAVLGYGLANFGGYLCGILMQMVAP